MKPTEELKHEHQVILLVLAGAERQAGGSGEVDLGQIGEMIEFFVNFVDRCHHAKEEKHLFVKMEERGIPHDDGPIRVMLDEHDQGRKLVAAMKGRLPAATAGSGTAAEALRPDLVACARLLRSHIDKEDNILYPMADRVFTSEDQRGLEDAFKKVELEEVGEGVHEKYHQLAHRLAQGSP
jgi:hemerythrin-like domain-containing protein